MLSRRGLWILWITGTLMIDSGKLPQFSEHTIATGLKGGYQVVAADFNKDAKPDLIALASDMPSLSGLRIQAGSVTSLQEINLI